MSKAKLKFNLSDPDDLSSFKRVVRADDMAYVIWEFMANSRKKIEREITNTDTLEGVDKVFEHFYNLLESKNLNIDDICT